MGGPAYIVLPFSDGDNNYNGRETSEIVAAIQEALHRQTHPEEYIEPEHIGPLKQIIENKDSLYKYISWEDPVRTLGAYIGALSVLFGAHYLPLTQVVLKTGLTTFGLVSIVEFASRSLSQNSISTRIRPEKYKKVPEPILNDTLNDVHDLIQWAVVHAQRIIYGQDLEKSFAAFLALTSLYWLIQLVSPFWLAVVALTSAFLPPLVASPRGCATARDAKVRTQELARVAVETGKELAQNGKDKATELSSKARQAAIDTKEHVQNLAQSGKQAATDGSAQVRDTASHISEATTENVRGLAQQVIAKTTNLSCQAQQATVDTKERVQDMAQNGKQSVINGSEHACDIASDISNSARDTATNIANSATDNARNKSQMDPNTMDKPPDTASSAVGDTKKYINRSLSSSKRPTSTYIEPIPLSADLIGTEKTGSAAETVSIYADAGDINGSHGTMNRPRGL
ncbi:hypothetical protein LTR47_011448 [Exophiala xenobiotica]|nr:hypothetical protein LTR72_011911 [Exophiala xenobiotica]KAK5219760.1 hypothetical protein LTR47_011448 [Exophiala xenobiotica]KAK5242253.1 hypothetical protein LTS06_011636 [Exophiala xenobiotica]KAK5279380.1 hypothetical protein LTR40_007886 [Exophiala xenobiotica]KAK5282901.1 hypothetical protein LTR14_011958 [Exophiala xenobiotica]